MERSCSSSFRYMQTVVMPGIAGTLLLTLALSFAVETGLIGNFLASMLIFLVTTSAVILHLAPPRAASLHVDEREPVRSHLD